MGWVGIGGALLLLLATPAHANLRAPTIVPTGVSAGPLPPAGDAPVEVLNERLSFSCDSNRCNVNATYRIRAQRDVTLSLTFIMATPEKAAAEVNGHSTQVSAAVPLAKLPPEADIPNDLRQPNGNPPPLFEVTFAAALVTGPNTVRVTYPQPLGREERGHSYWSKGRFLEFFRYELWPIFKWRRPAEFAIDLSITMPRSPPSLWKRWFGTARSIGCEGVDPAQPGTREQQGNTLRYAARIVSQTPRLWCYLGDEDLVPQR